MYRLSGCFTEVGKRRANRPLAECAQRPVFTGLNISPAKRASVPIQFHLPDKSGGFNGSRQHSARTRLALKTKAKSLARVRSTETPTWLSFDRVQPNRSVLPGNYRQSNALDGVAATS